ncbi:MAG: hypothetical protein B6244_03325 [Candidatus Cloacimonetes bacterium 4572_55]|nr:MAG: hypothetical protein B6244_03325 [Candidatus Cloacimonetes bacterium 4572_55]
MEKGSQKSGGKGNNALSQSLNRFKISLREGMRYRLELFSMELEEEKKKFINIITKTLIALFSLFMAFFFFNMSLFVIFWDFRVPLAVGLMVIYGLTTGLIGLSIRKKIVASSKPFTATIDELKRDQTWMKGLTNE